MLNLLLRRITLGLIAAVLTASAAAICVISAGFGLYALLRQWLSAPSAAGLTAATFAIVATVIVMFAPLIWKSKSRKLDGGVQIDSRSLGAAAEAGIALLAAALEMRNRSRAKSRGGKDRK